MKIIRYSDIPVRNFSNFKATCIEIDIEEEIGIIQIIANIITNER